MIPRIIHLNWLDEEPSKAALDSVAYWQTNGEGRHVVLHGDSSILRPQWRKNYTEYALNHQNKSDWMRWSQMLDVGGWYFDIDIRMSTDNSLDRAEKLMAHDTCLLVPVAAGMTMLESNIICCPSNWRGAEAVNAYFLAKHDGPFSYFHYTLELARYLHDSHPEWFTIGSARLLRNDRRNTKQQWQTFLKTGRRCGIQRMASTQPVGAGEVAP